MIRYNTEEYVSRRHVVNEMADIGTTPLGTIIRIYGSEGPVPHLHFMLKKGEEGCLNMRVADYFNHGSKQATLNSKYLENMVNFLSRKVEAPSGWSPDWTYYAFCCNTWNTNNPNNTFNRQAMPDYSKINK